MKEIFEIATRISTPLALAGLFAAILFFIFRMILSKVPALNDVIGGSVVIKIINSLFVLALVAMLLGFAGYVFQRVVEARYPALDPDYVDVAFDQDRRLKEIIAAVANGRNVTIVFDSTCSQNVQDAVIEKGNHEGRNIKDFLENLKDRVKGNSINYSVVEEGERRYEIVCRR